MKRKNEKKSMSDNTKRILSAIVLIPIVASLLIFGNVYVIDIALAIISIIALREYYNAISNICNPIRKVGYTVAISVFALHTIFIISIALVQGITADYMVMLILISNIILIFLMFILIISGIIYSFIKTIKTNMQTNLNDIVYTIFGTMYIVGFTIFLSFTYSSIGGRYLFWYILLIAWGTDIFAYAIGRRFGKYKFTSVSPNKSIEGAIAGIIGGVIFAILYTVFLRNYFNLNISYIYTGIMALILSIFSQTGDLAASSIKRHTKIKDFGKLIPGHGGILDRLDSIIFMAPVAYILLMLIR